MCVYFLYESAIRWPNAHNIHCSVQCDVSASTRMHIFFYSFVNHVGISTRISIILPSNDKSHFFPLSFILLPLFIHQHSYTLFKYVSIGHGVYVSFFSRYNIFSFNIVVSPATTFLLCLCIWGMSHILLLLICVLYVVGYYFLRFGCSCGYASYSPVNFFFQFFVVVVCQQSFFFYLSPK